MGETGVDWEGRIDWSKLRSFRTANIAAAMKKEGVKALLVQRYENVRYLTCIRPFTSLIYHPRYAAILFDDGRVCLLTEAGDLAHAKAKMPWLDEIRVWPYDNDEIIKNVFDALSENGVTSGQLAFDDVASPTVLFALLKKFPDLHLVDWTATLGMARACKSPEEIQVIRGAVEIAEVGMAAARDAIGEGVKESVLAARMVGSMIEAGADSIATFPQVSTDANRRMASDARLRYGQVVLLDINISFNGYVGDFARTYSVGGPNPEQKYAFQTQIACLNAAIGAVKPGVDIAEVHDAVKEVVMSAGLQEHWADYITGHGVGVSIGPFEQPLIGSTLGPMRTLEEGMVIAFEPGFFDPKLGPIRNEEMVLVTATGHEVLTKFGYCEKLGAA